VHCAIALEAATRHVSESAASLASAERQSQAAASDLHQLQQWARGSGLASPLLLHSHVLQQLIRSGSRQRGADAECEQASRHLSQARVQLTAAQGRDKALERLAERLAMREQLDSRQRIQLEQDELWQSAQLRRQGSAA
jgi:hypothetical protein